MSAPAAIAALARANRLIEARHGTRIGAGDDHEIGAAARRGGGTDLGQPILARHDLLVVEMAAFLREALVLDMDAGDPDGLVFAHGAHDVQFVAVAGIGIGDDRQSDRSRDPAGIGHHLRHRHQAEIGIAEHRRGAGAGHVDRVGPGTLDEPRRDAIIGTRRHHHPVAPQEFAKAGRLGHFHPPHRI